MKLLKNILVSSLLVCSALHANSAIKQPNCENSIPLQDFLKETSKMEEQLNLFKSKNLLLQDEKKKLQNEVRELKKAIDKNKVTPKTTQKKISSKFKAGVYKVTWDEANIYINNKPDSSSPYSLLKDERVEIENCDKFGWCKLKGKKLFIKRHTIAFDSYIH